MRNRGVDVCDVSPYCSGGALKQKCLIWNDRGQYDLLDMPEAIFGSRFGTCFKTHHCSLCFLLAAILNLALVGLTIGAPVIVAKHLGMQSSFVGIIEVAMGLGGLVGSGLVGIWPHRFSFKGICRYVAMICFGVVPIIVTLLSGPDELAFAALAAGSAWVMAWASITSVEIVSFVQRSAPKELCGKVLALVYMTLSCATPIGQLVYGLAYDRWTPAIVFAGMLAVLTLTTALFYRLKSRLWRLS